VLALVFVAAYEGSHDWGDLYVLIGFGIVGWFMKRLGWPRPPMVLGIVIGGIFERYLYISTSLYGAAWLLRPVVIVILCLVGWALFKPLSEIVVNVVREIREVKTHRLRFSPSASFTLAIIAFIIAAILLSTDWPASAKPVPLTACYMALCAAGLNLINELFGKQVSASARGNVDGGVAVNQVAHAAEPAPASREPIAWLAGLAARLPLPMAAAVRFFNTEASVYFAWLLAFLLSIWLIGFLPAIAIFVFAYMCLGFREPVLHSAGFAAVTVLLCWGLFDRTLAVAWPASLLGDLSPQLRAMVGFI
jgi:hypothetical protein